MTDLIQQLHSAISRRSWHDVEVAANAIRDGGFSSVADRYGVALMAIRAGCSDPSRVASEALGGDGPTVHFNGTGEDALRKMGFPGYAPDPTP